MKSSTIYRFIITGGGTGGHLYPALAVAQKLKQMKPEAEILFVGAKGRIESRVVPEYGIDFKPIWVSGFSRKLTLNNPQHYKNLRKPLQHLKRIHVDKSFVLTFFC